MNRGVPCLQPSNPFQSRSRAVLSMLGTNGHFPDGERDKIRLLDNERAMGSDLERDFPVLKEKKRPVLVRSWTGREVVVNDWVSRDKHVDFNSPVINTIARSIKCNSTVPRACGRNIAFFARLGSRGTGWG